MIIRITVIDVFKFSLPVAIIEVYFVKEEMCTAMCFMPFHKPHKTIVGKPHIVA